MIYITGDLHGYPRRIEDLQKNKNLTKDDIIILLGDVGLNYFGNEKDIHIKEYISTFIKAELFCIHGNHEMNPEYMDMSTKIWHGGEVFYEEKFPNILYAKDGEIYDIDNKKSIVLGGAYSIDKWYRLERGWHWFSDEQMSDDVKQRCLDNLEKTNYKVDIVLAHSLPYNYRPIDMFLPNIDQSTVDESTEEFFQDIYDKLQGDFHWYGGHYHTDRLTDNVSIMYEDVERFCEYGKSVLVEESDREI